MVSGYFSMVDFATSYLVPPTLRRTVLLLLEPVIGLSPTPLTLVAIVLSLGIGLVLVKVNNKPFPLV